MSPTRSLVSSSPGRSLVQRWVGSRRCLVVRFDHVSWLDMTTALPAGQRGRREVSGERE